MSQIESKSSVDLVSMIIASGATRMKAIEVIYSWKSVKKNVQRYVHRHGGNSTEGLDIFHEGIIALDRNIRTGKFRGEGDLEGYLFGICKFIWNNRFRKAKREISTDSVPDRVSTDNPETATLKLEERQLLTQIVNLLDESCKSILSMWKSSFTMTEIATALDLSSPALAKKYKYRCLKKLRAELASQPHLMRSIEHVRAGE